MRNTWQSSPLNALSISIYNPNRHFSHTKRRGAGASMWVRIHGVFQCCKHGMFKATSGSSRRSLGKRSHTIWICFPQYLRRIVFGIVASSASVNSHSCCSMVTAELHPLTARTEAATARRSSASSECKNLLSLQRAVLRRWSHSSSPWAASQITHMLRQQKFEMGRIDTVSTTQFLIFHIYCTMKTFTISGRVNNSPVYIEDTYDDYDSCHLQWHPYFGLYLANLLCCDYWCMLCNNHILVYRCAASPLRIYF